MNFLDKESSFALPSKGKYARCIKPSFKYFDIYIYNEHGSYLLFNLPPSQ